MVWKPISTVRLTADIIESHLFSSRWLFLAYRSFLFKKASVPWGHDPSLPFKTTLHEELNINIPNVNVLHTIIFIMYVKVPFTSTRWIPRNHLYLRGLGESTTHRVLPPSPPSPSASGELCLNFCVSYPLVFIRVSPHMHVFLNSILFSLVCFWFLINGIKLFTILQIAHVYFCLLARHSVPKSHICWCM